MNLLGMDFIDAEKPDEELLEVPLLPVVLALLLPLVWA